VKLRFLGLAIGALLALPAAAQAETYTFGVDVDAAGPATLPENHQADTLFFNGPGQPNSHASPVDGEVTQVRIKGTIVPKANKFAQSFEPIFRLFHIQTLRPETDGSYTVTSSTQHLYFPVDVDPSTITTFAAESPQCVEAGDVVDFNNVGGWDGEAADPFGTTYKIFGSAPGQSTYWYERDNGTNIGSNWLPNRKVDNRNGVTDTRGPIVNTQILMQVTVATGYDAAVNCKGGRKGKEYRGLALSTPSPAPKIYDDGVARVRVSCPENTYVGCQGTVRLSSDGKEIGSGSVRLNRSESTNVKIQLNAEGASLVATRGALDATATADSTDGYGVALTTTGTVRLTSARPATGGYAGVQARAQKVVVRKGKAITLKATCPAGTVGECSGTVSAQSQKRIIVRPGEKRGELYKMATGTYSIPAGKTARFPITLTGSGLKVLKKKQTVVAIATILSKDGSGRTASERVKVTFEYSGAPSARR
jgi:hypothetical protein